MTLSRRSLMKSAVALVVVTGAMSGSASAQALTAAQIDEALAAHKGETLVIASWGGSFQEAQRNAFFTPFAEKYGINIVEDGPPGNPKIVAMVEAGNTTWDLVDVGAYKTTPLGMEGYLEEIDYSIVDKTDIFPGFAPAWGVGNLSYSSVVAFRTDVLTGDQPTSVVDLWDLEKFPGKRAMRDNPIENLAYALQADGMAMEDIYPLTEEKITRAYKKLDEIKDQVIWWTQGATAPQLLVTKEVVMATAWNGRLDKIKEEGVPIGMAWNGAQLMGDAWAIPKNPPNKDLAMLFIAWATLPDVNWRLSDYITYGPVNFKAIENVSEDRRALVPTTFAHLQISADYDYWGTAYNDQVDRWNEWRLE